VYGESETFKCSFPEALKFVEKKCQGKEECSMSTAPELFGAGPAAVGQTRDPCPRYRKYVEVAYKCKPLQVGLIPLSQFSARFYKVNLYVDLIRFIRSFSIPQPTLVAFL